MSQGRRNRQLPRVAPHAARRDVAPGARRARPRARPRGVQRRDAVATSAFVDFAVAWWPPLDAPSVLGWLRDPELPGPGRRGRAQPRGPAAARQVVGRDRTPLAVGRGRRRCSTSCATRSATCRRRTRGRRTTLDDRARGRVDLQELTTAADREYAPSGRAWTPPTHRIEDDGFAHVLVDEAQDLTPMQWRMVGRRGRTASWTIVGDPAQSSWPVPAEAAAARAEALEGKDAARVPPLDQLPQLLRDLRLRRGVRRAGRPRRRPADRGALHRRRAARGHRGRRPRGRDPRGGAPRWPARSAAPSASWCRSPGAPRSTPGWRRGRSSPTTPPAPGAAVDSSVTPVRRGPGRRAHRPRHQGPGVRRHRRGPPRRRSRTSRPPAAPRSTSCSPARRSC